MALLEVTDLGFAHGAGRGFELRVADVRIDAGERVAGGGSAPV